MRHIISILLQNESGALARVAGLFSARGYNIESLSVAPTDDAAMSRLTLVTSGTDAVIAQITKQLNKLIDVVAVQDMTLGEHVERELLLVKVAAEGDARNVVREIVNQYHARVLDDTEVSYTMQLTGSSQEVDNFVSELSAAVSVTEVVRSGVAAIAKGAETLSI